MHEFRFIRRAGLPEMKIPRDDVLLLTIDELTDWPSEPPVGERAFNLFIVVDGRDLSRDDFAAWDAFANRIADQQVAYLSSWGAQCELVHDLMDEVIVEREVKTGVEQPLVMTTWHEDEELEEALEFQVWSAWNMDVPGGDTLPVVITLVGRPELTGRVEAFFGT